MSDKNRKAAITDFMAKQEPGVELVQVGVLTHPSPVFKSEMLIIETSRRVDGKIVNQQDCVFVSKD